MPKQKRTISIKNIILSLMILLPILVAASIITGGIFIITTAPFALFALNIIIGTLIITLGLAILVGYSIFSYKVIFKNSNKQSSATHRKIKKTILKEDDSSSESYSSDQTNRVKFKKKKKKYHIRKQNLDPKDFYTPSAAKHKKTEFKNVSDTDLDSEFYKKEERIWTRFKEKIEKNQVGNKKIAYPHPPKEQFKEHIEKCGKKLFVRFVKKIDQTLKLEEKDISCIAISMGKKSIEIKFHDRQPKKEVESIFKAIESSYKSNSKNKKPMQLNSEKKVIRIKINAYKKALTKQGLLKIKDSKNNLTYDDGQESSSYEESGSSKRNQFK